MRIGRYTAAGFGAACLCGASIGFAADLRPTLVLPSQRETSVPMQQQMPQQQMPQQPMQQQVPMAAPAAQPAGPSEAFYTQFDEDARKMERARREALRKDFVKRYDAAKRRNAVAEMKHYQRLLGILATIATERGEAR